MQVTAFISLLSLDDERERSSRFDVLCCFKAKSADKILKKGKFGDGSDCSILVMK